MEKHICCGTDNLEKKLKDLKILDKFKKKSIPSSSVVIKNIPHNPYLSSITGIYAFDLSKISTFKMYFWKPTDPQSLNQAVEYTLNPEFLPPITPETWPANYQTQTLSAFSQYTSFMNKTASITTSYENSDVVCVLAPFNELGSTFGPFWIYNFPGFVDNKIVFFLSSTPTTDENILEGGEQYLTIIHEFGHGFGLQHPHGDFSGSTVMPGLVKNVQIEYPSIAGHLNNTVFNTVMSFNDFQFFLPYDRDFSTSKIGYPQTLMPLDASALRWMYNLSSAGNEYISKYGVKVINPSFDRQRSQMIVGKNQQITFGSNCFDINFYFSNNNFRFNNIEPVSYQYNRILEKYYTFYPQDLCSTVAVLNFSNTQSSNIFIEKNALKTNLTINCLNNTILNIYIIDYKNSFCIKGNTYIDKKTGKKLKINNKSGATINVFFNK